LELFFDPPYFDQGAFALARSVAQPVTLGSLFTQGAIGGMSNFTGPVYVIDGAGDFPFCDRNCYAPTPTAATIPEGVKMLYPSASNFSTFIIPETGHGISES
jgi:hypothetical protein